MISTGIRRVLPVWLFLCILAAQAPKPNFTGMWKMNPSKSDYGSMEAPQMVTRKIDHQEPNLTMVAVQKSSRGEMTTEFKYATDGKEYVNKTRLGDAKTTLRWEGETLVVSTQRSVMGRDISIVDRWTLSPDGKTLTVTGTLKSGAGNGDYKVIFDKQ